MKIILYLLPVFFLTGCVTSWTKNGMTKSEFIRDKQFCQLYSHGDRNDFDRCMKERDYEKHVEPRFHLSFTRTQLLDHFGLVPRVNPMGPSALLYIIDRTA